MRYLFIFFLGFFPLYTATAQTQQSVESFRDAKKLLYSQIYGGAGERVTFYCGCTYNSSRVVNARSCGLKAHSYERFANDVQAEHVLPVSHGQQHFPCWREPKVEDGGQRPNEMSGRDYCGEVDPAYQKFEADLHNLVPAVGSINMHRSAKQFGMIPGEQRNWGRCDFESNSKAVEPRDVVKGDAARIYMYMSDAYNIRLSSAQRKLFEAWHKMDPPDAWERLRDQRIHAIQGTSNPYIWQ